MFLISSIDRSWASLVPSRRARRAVEAASVVVASCLATALWPVERVTWENLDRIEVGMTRAEVRQVLVRWPDERTVADGRIAGPRSFRWTRDRGSRSHPAEVWESAGLSIIVIYDDRGRVACRFSGIGHVRDDWLSILPPSCRGWIARLF